MVDKKSHVELEKEHRKSSARQGRSKRRSHRHREAVHHHLAGFSASRPWRPVRRAPGRRHPGPERPQPLRPLPPPWPRPPFRQAMADSDLPNILIASPSSPTTNISRSSACPEPRSGPGTRKAPPQEGPGPRCTWPNEREKAVGDVRPAPAGGRPGAGRSPRRSRARPRAEGEG